MQRVRQVVESSWVTPFTKGHQKLALRRWVEGLYSLHPRDLRIGVSRDGRRLECCFGGGVVTRSRTRRKDPSFSLGSGVGFFRDRWVEVGERPDTGRPFRRRVSNLGTGPFLLHRPL